MDAFLDALPRLATALAVLVVGWVAGAITRRLVRPQLRRRRAPSFSAVVSKLIGWAVGVAGTIVAVTIAFPSVQPVDVLAGLGVFSIAAGLAFQDILSNLLAGLLLIFRQPFVSGDQIAVGEHEGTVEEISIRETSIRTYDGVRVIIPNTEVYQSAIQIQTAFASRRTSLVVGVGYDADLAAACRACTDALATVDGVAEDPAPEALLTTFDDSAISIDVRYWTEPQQLTHRRVLHEAVLAVKAALDDAGIDIPFPIRTLDAADSLRTALADASAARRSSVGRP